MLIETLHWHSVLARCLGPGSRVLDLGANHGRFAKAVVERFDCCCVAVEPSPSIAAGMLRDDRIVPMQLAVAPRNGEVELFESVQTTSSSIVHRPSQFIRSVRVEAVRIEELLATLEWDYVDLVKMDVEGMELEILNSLPDSVLARIGQLSVEFHDFNAMYPSQEVLRVLRRLSDRGWWSLRMSRVGHQDTLIVNRARCPTSVWERARARVVDRNWLGAVRVASRIRARLASGRK